MWIMSMLPILSNTATFVNQHICRTDSSDRVGCLNET